MSLTSNDIDSSSLDGDAQSTTSSCRDTSKRTSITSELVGVMTPKTDDDDNVSLATTLGKMHKLSHNEDQYDVRNKVSDLKDPIALNCNDRKIIGYDPPKVGAYSNLMKKIIFGSLPHKKEMLTVTDTKTNSCRGETRISQWEGLMRKFSEAHKEECKTVSLDIPRAPRSVKQFPTGSKYEGSWDLLGMSGFGTYTFPNGVVYIGDFEDGMFQGDGELQYPDGAILRGTWNKGHMVDKTLFFADGLQYCEKDWGYCKMPDRRFTIEYENGLQPGGKSYMTADQPTRQIPDGYYDTGDGFYDPKTKIVFRADDVTNIVRSAGPEEAKWIEDNCRTSPDNPVGPRPDLYEEWLQPQLKPEAVPPPAAVTLAYRRDSEFSDDFDMDSYYETCKSRFLGVGRHYSSICSIPAKKICYNPIARTSCVSNALSIAKDSKM